MVDDAGCRDYSARHSPKMQRRLGEQAALVEQAVKAPPQTPPKLQLP